MVATEHVTVSRQEILRLRSEGLSQREVAKQLGCSRLHVRQVEAGMAGPRDEGQYPLDGGLVEVPLGDITDNPWQPRQGMGQEELVDLAENIGQVGLLQHPVGRRIENGQVQLAFGHRRVAAVRILAERGQWEGGVGITLREIDDQALALLALSENRKRKDLTPLEEYKAFKKVLDTIPGMTIQALADGAGVDRSTLSNNLRILQLPAVVLDRVEAGEMPARSAREFLCLMNDDHAHVDDMEWVVKSIARTGGRQGSPDWRTDHVRNMIRDRVHYNETDWRPLRGQEGDTDHMNYGGGHREPSFDVETFTKERSHQVHNIPAKKVPSRPWTCNVKEWRRLQTTGTRQKNIQAAAGTLPAQPRSGKEGQLMRVLVDDPVGKGVLEAVSRETVAKQVAEGLRPSPEEALGPYSRNSGYLKLNTHLTPFYLDNPGECREKCNWGAAYGVDYQGAKPSLVCTNEECFTKKADKGKEAYQAKLDARVQQETEKDEALVEQILENGISQELADMVATALVSSHGHFPPIDGTDGKGRNRDWDFDYYPGTLKRVVELLQLKQPTRFLAFESDAALRALKTAPAAMREEVAAQLLVYSLRQA